MTKYVDLFASLAAPFDKNEVKTRAQAGRQLSYITARTAMNRLDSVLGGENWWDEYFSQENSVLCRLTIRFPDGSTVTKCDAGGYAGMADQGDDDKSGYSDAFKRAAVKFGVGRYLYRDGVPDYGQEPTEAAVVQPQRQEARSPAPRRDDAPEARQEPQGEARVPKTGKALFAWTKEQEQRYDIQLLKYLNGWAKLQDYPGRMVDWDWEQVGRAYAEGCRKIEFLVAESTQSTPRYPMPVMHSEPADNGEDIPF